MKITKKDNKLKFTVVIPTKNQGRFIEATIKSILKQNYPHIEAILYDGGSNDGTLEIVEKYRASLTAVHVKEDTGQADAIRKGFAAATGDILCWINSDDVFLPNAFEVVNNYFLEHKDIDFVVGNTIIINEHAGLWKGRFGFPVCNIGAAPTFKKTLLWGSGYNQSSSFWRRNAYETYGGIDSSFGHCMDRDNELKFLSVKDGGYINSYLSAFRVHPYSKTNNQQEVKRHEDSILADRYRKESFPLSTRVVLPVAFETISRLRNLWRSATDDISKECDWIEKLHL